MSFTPVPHVATGDLYSAASYNTYISDNFAAGVPDIFTAAGDLAYATGADAATRLAIGAAGSFLRSNGATPGWSNINAITPPAVKSGNQVLTQSSTTYQDVTEMVKAMAANESWLLLFLIGTQTANTAPGFKFSITVPAAATLLAGGFVGNNPGNSTTSGGDISSENGVGITHAWLWAVINNGVNAGNAQLRAAQLSSHASNCTILQNSIMLPIRLS